MIRYNEVKKGDILELVGEADGYAEKGDLLKVTEVHADSVVVVNRDHEVGEFYFNCGAARLSPTKWHNDDG